MKAIRPAAVRLSDRPGDLSPESARILDLIGSDEVDLPRRPGSLVAMLLDPLAQGSIGGADFFVSTGVDGGRDEAARDRGPEHAASRLDLLGHRDTYFEIQLGFG